MNEIILIAAMDYNNAIGRDNKLLCKLQDDMDMFKFATKDNIVVMGRKTFESIGKPLPNRHNVVLTRDKSYTVEERSDLLVLNSIEEFFYWSEYVDKDIFVVGGTEIYEQFLPHATALLISRIEAFFDDADSFFPQVNWDEWESVKGSGQYFPKNERNEYPFTHFAYMR